jgi:5-methylcytosine-specific restriction protein B
MDPTEILQRLFSNYNVLIYGPPGTGKTYLMQQVARLFMANIEGSNRPSYAVDTTSETKPIVTETAKHAKVGWVTFHQSYSYEEFVVGLRPNPSSTQILSLAPQPGLLLDLAEFARLPEHYSLLIIDEINRGNVSRIFGEFITLLEPDKRLDNENQPTASTVAISLPYVKGSMTVEIGGSAVQITNPYMMPVRVYTLASMNSVDKSVAPLDTALRRRFHIVNLMPNLEEMAHAMGLTGVIDYHNITLRDPISDVKDVCVVAISLVNALNHGISLFLGSEFSLGEWYLKDLIQQSTDAEEAKALLARIWQFNLLPQMEELFHGRIEQLALIFKLDPTNAELPVNLVEPDEDMAERGAIPYLQKRQASVEEIIRFLRRLCGIKSASSSP